MDYSNLANIIRARADGSGGELTERQFDSTDAELLRVLARLLEGKTADRAFGAPGDWGYGTPIGSALYAATTLATA